MGSSWILLQPIRHHTFTPKRSPSPIMTDGPSFEVFKDLETCSHRYTKQKLYERQLLKTNKKRSATIDAALFLLPSVSCTVPPANGRSPVAPTKHHTCTPPVAVISIPMLICFAPTSSILLSSKSRYPHLGQPINYVWPIHIYI